MVASAPLPPRQPRFLARRQETPREQGCPRCGVQIKELTNVSLQTYCKRHYHSDMARLYGRHQGSPPVRGKADWRWGGGGSVEGLRQSTNTNMALTRTYPPGRRYLGERGAAAGGVMKIHLHAAKSRLGDHRRATPRIHGAFAS